MNNWKRSAAGYVAAVLATACALVLRVPFQGVLTQQYPFATYYPAVAIIAWQCGLGPGVFAAALAGVLGLGTVLQHRPAEPADLVGLMYFVLYGVVFSFASERRLRATEQLTAQRRWTELTLASITDGVITSDADGRVQYLNECAEKITGWTRADAIGRPLAEVVDQAGAASASGAASARHVERTDLPMRTGRSEGTVTVLRDNTARVQAEQRLTQLMMSNVIGLLFGDIRGGIHEANDEFLRIVGRTREELKAGRLDWVQLSAPEHLPAAEQALAEARQRGTCTPYEKEYVRPDGTRAPVLIGYVLLEPERERSVAFIVDLTARKEYEQALARTNEDLQHFTYGAGHDLKEPLRMVGSYTQLLARRYRGKLDTDADEYIQFILGGVERMRNLVEALLEYSRAGQSPATASEPASADLALADALVALQASIEEAGATVDADPLPTVVADAMQLSQLFQNLIGNAIKYRSEQAPQVRVTSQVRDGWCTFCVDDNGAGIPPNRLEDVFVPFTRLHGKTIPGTGLGLATSRRMVERQGGRMWVESDGPGAGSAFYFTLRRYTPGG